MSTETINARIRVRPLRFGFVLNPSERKTLRRVIETNTCLWNGLFNFIIPLFKRTPMLYRDQYLPGPTKQLMDGLVEAFEPDFLVEETREGAISDGTLELLNEWAGLTQYPSIYQVNVKLDAATPTGDAVPLQIQMGGGALTTDQLKIAVTN